MQAVAEIMEAFEDDMAPTWADAATDAWERAVKTAENAGCDPEPIFADATEDRFVPTTDAELEWALLKRDRIIKRIAEIDELYEAESWKLRNRFDTARRAEQRAADFFTSMLETAVMSVEPDAKGHRKLKVPAGTIYTQRREKWTWPDDDDQLIEWARTRYPEALRVKESVDKAAAKAHAKDTGELPPGVEVAHVESVVIK